MAAETNRLPVDVQVLPAIPAGTNNIGDVDVLTLPGIAGDIAHSATDSGNPVKAGGVAVAHGASPTAVDAGERTNLYANRHGIPYHLGGHPNILTLRATYTSAQTDTAIITVSAGTKIVVTQVMVTASAATSANVSVLIGFAAANTPTTTGVVASHPGLKSLTGGGFVRGAGSGILGIGADGEDLRITSSAATDGAIDVVVSYFTIES